MVAMIATLPLPQSIGSAIPSVIRNVFERFAYYSFGVLLMIPWFICQYRLIMTPLGRNKRVWWRLHDVTAPKILIVIPIYKENPESLWNALVSVVESDYPVGAIHLFLSFDGEDLDELYLSTLVRLGIPIEDAPPGEFPLVIDWPWQGTRITVSRFPHGGKRQCQKNTYQLIERIYEKRVQITNDMFILFSDSDCILDPNCIRNFMYDMQLIPKGQHEMLAMTGVITSFTHKPSFITLLQDMEYIHGQLYERSVESGCGAVTCLPGALTILRYSAFRNIAKYYFSTESERCEDLFDFGKTHLGEDRWLTHLLMVGARHSYQIQMSTSAFCKTEAVQTFRALLKQRRRWFLGYITNEVCMLTDSRLWQKYPLLCLLRLGQNTIRTTPLLLAIMAIAAATTSSTLQQLPWEFVLVAMGMNWIVMMVFAVRTARWKAMLYPLMYVINPFLNWLYLVNAIFTAGQRTWGGPRVDAEALLQPPAGIEGEFVPRTSADAV
jgi:chitin synthase